jgi:hypothetical protein
LERCVNQAAVVRVLFAGAIAATLAALGCSGSQPEPTFKGDDPDELAAGMIPEAGVLPGTGWRVVSENDFADDDVEISDLSFGEDCDPVVRELLTPVDEFEDEYDGRARREFQLDADGRPADFALTVEVTTLILADRAAADSDMALVEHALGDPRLSACFAQTLETIYSSPNDDGSSTDFDVAAAEPMTSAPRGGAGWAFLGKIHETGQDWFRIEEYQWSIGNATVYVYIEGDSDDVTAEFVRTVLARLDGSANVAVARD